MAKSNAEKVRICMARKRAHARELGLCTRCCKEKPRLGRTICPACSASTIERMRRLRQKKRHTAELEEIIALQERAGDRAYSNHLYDDAAQRYESALKTQEISSRDYLRIAEKLTRALFLGDDPGAASPWLDRVLTAHLADAQGASKAVDILLEVVRQLGIVAKTAAALPLIERAIHIAEASGDARLHKMAHIRMAHSLSMLGRFSEAKQSLHTVGKVTAEDDLSVRIAYHWRKGVLAAVFGRMTECYENFEQTVRLAKEDPDLYRMTIVWSEYAFEAMLFGDVDRSKACRERALLLARRNNITWRIPHICLGQAELLARMGEQSAAFEYLLEALSCDAHAPLLDIQFTSVGIPLALTMNDDKILMRCTRPAAFDLALQTGEPEKIGATAAAFAQLYRAQGKKHKAKAVLRKALGYVNYMDECPQFPLEIARQGMFMDIPQARASLEARIHLPCSDVAQAFLELFEAYVNRRERNTDEMHTHATAAVERFTSLRWHGYADIARSLLSAAYQLPKHADGASGAFAEMKAALTVREQQVVEWALQGFTNREIAQRLAIREHTIEKHMSSIMNRLGIRSRHQLLNILPESKTS